MSIYANFSKFSIIKDRIKNPKENSYTSKIAKDERKIIGKIKEESEELSDYKDKQNLIWEAADLVYLIFVLMAKNNLDISDIKNELWKRRR